MRGRRLAALAVAIAALAAAGCGSDDDTDEAAEEDAVSLAPDSMRVDSPLFEDGAELPVEATCDGKGVSPPLRWSNVPDRARELALIVDDPDAPDPPFTHWVVYSMRPDVTRIAAGSVPGGAVQGQSSDGQDSYVPPCPPEGDGDHRYEFNLYASGGSLDLQPGATADQVIDALGDSTLARGTLTGMYSR